MLHFLIKKSSQYIIVMSFVAFAVSAMFITIQTQNEFRDSSLVNSSEETPIVKEVEVKSSKVAKALTKIVKKQETEPRKTIYISNFPVKTGHISSRYGMRKDPFTGRRAMHRGIDIAARSGSKVHPVGKGKVIFSGWKAGHGRTIEVEHSNTVVSRYSHLKKLLVKKGKTVITTDVIGQVGSSGRSTGPHLHLEIAFNGQTSNPREFLSRELASTE